MGKTILLQIHVVNEKRLYSVWTEKGKENKNLVSVDVNTGLLAVRNELNGIHKHLASNGFTEVSELLLKPTYTDDF